MKKKVAAKRAPAARAQARRAPATKAPAKRARARRAGAATLPLAGLRILDLGTRIAAPFAATLLADFGAEVIKVEQPGVGDFMRTIGPFEDGYSLWWAVEGRNKKSITLDLRKPEGQELLKRLVAEADAVVENFQPGTLEGWNLGPDVLHAINPSLVLSRVSVYGQTGPYRDRPGLDRNGIAMGGLLHLTGYKDRPPVRPGIIVSDYLTGIFNALGVMIALYERDRRDDAGHRGARQRTPAAARHARRQRRCRSSTWRSMHRSCASSSTPCRPTITSASSAGARATASPTRRRSTTGRPPTGSSSP